MTCRTEISSDFRAFTELVFSIFPKSVWGGDNDSWIWVISFVGRTTPLNFLLFVSVQWVYQYIYLNICAYISIYIEISIYTSTAALLPALSQDSALKAGFEFVFFFAKLCEEKAAEGGSSKMWHWNQITESSSGEGGCTAWGGTLLFQDQVIREELHLGAEASSVCPCDGLTNAIKFIYGDGVVVILGEGIVRVRKPIM